MSTNGTGHHDDPHTSVDEQSLLYVKVAEDGLDDFVELPTETDNTILLTTLKGQFPNAVGMKFKSPSGGWRGVRVTESFLHPPPEGWGERTYCIAVQKETGNRKPQPNKVEPKSKTEKESKSVQPEKAKASEKHLLEDMIVFGLPFKCKDEDLKEYFTKECGEMALHQVKFDRSTKKSRGFGFIRFKTVEAAKKALTGKHSIMGMNCEVRLSKKKVSPMKIFIGKIPQGTTEENLKEHFQEFGEICDSYIPTPFKSFGFITFTNTEDAHAALRKDHRIGNDQLNVQYADTKEVKTARKKRVDVATGEPRRVNSQVSLPQYRDVREEYSQSEPTCNNCTLLHEIERRSTSELKDMLVSMLNTR